jgi:hypothetical protein
MIKKSVSTTMDTKVKLDKQLNTKRSTKRSSAAAWLSKQKRKVLLDKLLGEFLVLHKEAMESVKNEITDPIKRVEALTRLSQALDRTLNALIKATPQTANLTIAQDVLKHQVAFVEANFPQHAAALLTILEPFGAELIKIFEE